MFYYWMCFTDFYMDLVVSQCMRFYFVIYDLVPSMNSTFLQPT